MRAAERLLPHVGADEQLLWAGGPEPRRIFAIRDAFLGPLILVWCGVIVIFIVPGGFRWGEVPFALIGLCVVFGALYYVPFRNSRTVYAVTTRRALIVGPWSFKEMPLRHTPISVRRSRKGGRATVVFGDPGDLPSSWPNLSRKQAQAYANTILEFRARKSLPFTFYEVSDPDPLLRALEQAGTH